MKDNDTTEHPPQDHRLHFIEQASQIGLRALIELIHEQRLSCGRAALRIEVDGAVWEITAKCLLQKGPWGGSLISWLAPLLLLRG